MKEQFICAVCAGLSLLGCTANHYEPDMQEMDWQDKDDCHFLGEAYSLVRRDALKGYDGPDTIYISYMPNDPDKQIPFYYHCPARQPQ